MHNKQNFQYRIHDIRSQKRVTYIFKMKDLNQISASSKMLY